MHLRVKRKDETVFLECEPSDSFGKLKARLADVLGLKAPPRLTSSDKLTPLEDGSLVADAKLLDDAIIYWTLSESERVEADEWELGPVGAGAAAAAAE